MAELDAMMQDYTYLKSLERKNQTPRKLSRKLMLPDPRWAPIIWFARQSDLPQILQRVLLRPKDIREDQGGHLRPHLPSANW